MPAQVPSACSAAAWMPCGGIPRFLTRSCPRSRVWRQLAPGLSGRPREPGRRRGPAAATAPGVDGVFLGPDDLSISAGFPSPSSPQTLAALRQVFEAGRQADKIVGFMAGTPELLSLAPEADLVAMDTDVAALRLGLSQVFS